MGITGLIPFLEKASKRANISEFSGGCVAVDTYCWLHRGAFSCADKIALGQPTDGYVKYCMRLVHMLQANKIKPILVFDGRHLPAKKETEVKRRENRESIRRRAAELMRMGQTTEGRHLLRRSIDITHEMALQLIQQCQEENVDCIVAPYEADAQLAYLNVSGIADVVITEDSDLTLFGCKKVFFKMDINGNGILVEQDRIHLAMNVRKDHFDFEKFRHMCILSGCDYLPSLPGIGLNKACKFVQRNSEADIHKALTRLGAHLNMKGLVVTQEYRDAFMCALVTFKHQLVYCPLRRAQIRLNPPTPEVTKEQLHFAGIEIDEELAYQTALGNCHPFSEKRLHDFDPDCTDKHKRKTNSWHGKAPPKHTSIWATEYKIPAVKENKKKDEILKWPSTTGQINVLNTDALKRKTTTPTKKRFFTEMTEELSVNEVLNLYGGSKLHKNDEIEDPQRTSPNRSKLSPDSESEEKTESPKLMNPFAKASNDGEGSPSLVCRGKRRIKLKTVVGFRPTVIDKNNVECSKFFGGKSTTKEMEEEEKNVLENVELPPGSKIIETESMNYEETSETNFIEESPNNEEISNSSGFFSSNAGSEQSSTRFERNVARCVFQRKSSVELDILLDRKCNTFEDLPERKDESENGSMSDANATNNRMSVFKWANPKLSGAKKIVNTLPSKQKIETAGRSKPARKNASQIKTGPIEGQQSLLNKFGFQKKTVLKH